MNKTYRFILVAMLISLIAGSAFAGEKGGASQWYTLTEVDAVDSPSGRDVYILTYDFSAMPQDYIAAGYQFGSEGILPEGATMVGFGFDGVEADVYENEGAPFSNWASEAWLGCTYMDPVDGLSFVGVGVFEENEGPGHFGPASNYFALEPADWPMPTDEDFTFYANTSWDDATGLAAGTFTAGVVYVEIESSVVGTDDVTMSGVKALYR